MIGYLEGSIISVKDDSILLKVGGVGYNVSVIDPDSYQVGTSDSFHIETRVRENDISLYGFDVELELIWFNRLCAVNSIGPKAALSLLKLGFENFNDALWNSEVAFFTQANGVGKRGAEKLISDLKKYATEPNVSADILACRHKLLTQSTTALKSFGYAVSDIKEAQQSVLEEISEQVSETSPQDFIKLCIQKIS